MQQPPTISPPPSSGTAEEIASWALQELQALGNLLFISNVKQVEELNAAPPKPRTGMVVLADGTNWNPGSGRGYYGYDEATAAWRFLG